MGKVSKVIILSAFQIGLFVLIHDYILQSVYEAMRMREADLNWGITMRYFFYVFIGVTLLYNLLYYVNSWKYWSIYVLIILFGLGLLVLSGFDVSMRSLFVMVCVLASILLPYHILRLVFRFRNSKTDFGDF